MSHAGITANCTTCHAASTTGTVFLGVTPVAQGSGHIPTTADCATCHKSTTSFGNTTMVHTGISSGCATCHDAGKSFSTVKTKPLVVKPGNHIPTSATCESCHAAGNFTTFAGNAVTLMKHAVVAGTPCANCHEAGRSFVGTPAVVTRPTTSQDPNHPTTGECGTCHSSTTSFTLGIIGLPANHIPVGALACTQCHAGGNTGPGSGKMSHAGITANCTTCHAASTTGTVFLGVTPVAQGSGHIPTTADCATCHKSTTSFGNTTMVHTGISSGCATCHDAGKSFSTVKTKPLVVKPGNHIPTSATCESCHAAGNFTTFAGNAVTLMKHAVVAGTPCANCHEAGRSFVGTPAVVTRPTTSQDPNHPTTGECGTCHSSTTSFTLGIIRLPANHIPVGALACTQCHAGGNTGPGSGKMSHAGITANCTTCHAASTTGTVFLGVTPVAQGSGHIPTTADCATCHKSTTSFGNTTMVHTGISSGCATCHDAGKSFSTVKTKPLVVKPGNHIPTSATCESCHAAGNFTTFAGNAVTLMKHAVVAGTPCANCHEAGRSFVGTPAVVTRPTTSQDPNHPTTGECGTCHSSTTSFTLGITGLPANHIPVGALACTQCHAGGNTGPGSGKMSHAGITANCTTCHAASTTGTVFLGVTPVAQGSGHIPTTADCATCHKSTTSFGNTTMVHTGISSGCATCHDAGKSFSTVKTKPLVVKPGNHIPTSATCESCHAAGNFTTFAGNAVTLMKHAVVAGTPCANCHEAGRSFVGTPAVVTRPTTSQDPNHPTTGECGTCHSSTTSFTLGIVGLPANHIPVGALACTQCHAGGNTGPGSGKMSHAGITANCTTCHAASTTGTVFLGVTPVAQGSGHIPTTADCATCHKSTTSFGNTTMVHTGISSGCATCHDAGKSFSTVKTKPLVVKPGNHIPTSATCESCHAAGNFTTFAGNAVTLMKHAVVAGTPCANCHEAGRSFVGTPAVVTRPTTSQDPNHPTTGECGTCHSSTTSFSSGVTGGKPANHIPTTAACALCHTNPNNLVPGVMNHTGITSGCTTCHAASTTGTAFTGVTPKPQGTGHIPTTADCAVCHTSTTVFGGSQMVHTGITTGCATCHDAGKSFSTVKTKPLVVKPGNHIPTTTACETCHKSTSTFAGTQMNHTGITTGCKTCHATGPTGMAFAGVTPKPQGSGHEVTTADCSTCHTSTTSFSSGVTSKPANHIPTTAACTLCHAGGNTGPGSGVMNHTGITAGCTTCHAASTTGTAFTGVTPKPQGTGHIPTTADCAVCHTSTTVFGGSQMVHTGITTGCATCHDAGKSFSTVKTKPLVVKPGNHIPTTTACETCHKSTSTFAGTQMNHTGITTGCKTCHATGPTGMAFAGVTPKPQGSGHEVTTADCSTCHTSTTSFSSGVTSKPANHIPTTAACTLCHAGGNTGPGSGVMNHTGITAGCTTCHAASTTGTAFTGVTPKPQGTGHIPTTADCATCHKSTTTFDGALMVHTGITTGCATCHDTGKSFSTVNNLKTKPSTATHIPTTAACESCHKSTTTFATWTMNHTGITTGCANCHGGQYSGVKTKPRDHPTTTAPCETCHNRGISFDTGGRAAVAATPTQSAGAAQVNPVNGSAAAPTAAVTISPPQATASVPTVVATAPVANSAAVGATAGSVAAPIPAARNPVATGLAPPRPGAGLAGPGSSIARHAGVMPGSCATCHNGATAPGKPGKHLVTSASCDTCHRTTAWIPATFTHVGVAPNTCATCHNGAGAKGKPAGHFVSTRSCDTCHRTTAWLPPTAYRHVSPAYKQHTGGVKCVELPHGQQRDRGMEGGRVQAGLRGLPRQRVQADGPREGGESEDPLHGRRIARLQLELPRVRERVVHDGHEAEDRRPSPDQRRLLTSRQATSTLHPRW